MSSNPVIQFLVEAWNRLGQTQPKFFKIITNVFAVIALIVYVPQALTLVGITLPPQWSSVLVKIVGAVSAAVAFVSKLSVSQATTVATNDPGTLPFTANNITPTRDQIAQAKQAGS
jgi:hypothetical protein